MRRELLNTALEHVLQRKLNQARIHRSIGNHAEGAASYTGAGICELRVVERIEELRSKFQTGVFVDTTHFGLFD